VALSGGQADRHKQPRSSHLKLFLITHSNIAKIGRCLADPRSSRHRLRRVEGRSPRQIQGKCAPSQHWVLRVSGSPDLPTLRGLSYGVEYCVWIGCLLPSARGERRIVPARCLKALPLIRISLTIRSPTRDSIWPISINRISPHLGTRTPRKSKLPVPCRKLTLGYIGDAAHPE
jgi:hypothetical protein